MKMPQKVNLYLSKAFYVIYLVFLYLFFCLVSAFYVVPVYFRSMVYFPYTTRSVKVVNLILSTGNMKDFQNLKVFSKRRLVFWILMGLPLCVMIHLRDSLVFFYLAYS